MAANFAPPLAQSSPHVTPSNEYKDSSPHFSNIEALSALIGTIVSQLFQAGAPFTDTLGNFRPIVISSAGVTINASPAHPASLTFHDTQISDTDLLLTGSFPQQLILQPNRTSAGTVEFLVADSKAVVGVSSWFSALASSGEVTLSAVSPTAGAGGYIWGRTIIARVKAGAPVDGDYATPRDGMLVVDSTNNKLWARHGGAWHFVALT